ncbi:peptidylprolyl isomerase [Mucilaginibacter mali]|uniref:peptidylprolyl isomerase n=1 Tax=Mucilaginibacter mali TaxID=2740462 RepID=A0A7D4QEC3_9SPHI|nr:peptidylprolyl isomerase [Mucilaginibacter mali]QKJ32024.1 peptidylprolyl isomerase [Mucilaginibacter mali]
MRKQISLLVILLIGLTAGTLQAQPTNQYVKIETAQGYCIVKLYNETPVHRENFISLVKKHYFDATTFNRILKGFVIQGGDPDSLYEKGRKLKPEMKWIKPEFAPNLFHKRGVLAMGRDDNKDKESFTTQIYFVDGRKYTDAQLDAIEKRNNVHFTPEQREVYRTVGGTPSLDQNYTVFGEIVKGMDWIDKVTALKVDKNGNPDTPVGMRVTVLTVKEVAKELK